jgi:hypothetical protein
MFFNFISKKSLIGGTKKKRSAIKHIVKRTFVLNRLIGKARKKT